MSVNGHENGCVIVKSLRNYDVSQSIKLLSLHVQNIPEARLSNYVIA